MTFFDPYVHSDTRSDADLRNLAYFGTERILCCAHAARRFEGADAIVEYFQELLTQERRRVEQHGISPTFALGLSARGAPEHAFHELWRELPSLLAEPDVVAIGELGLEQRTEREYGLVEHQMRLAASLDLPCIVRLPREHFGAPLRQLLGCVRRSGLGRARCILVHDGVMPASVLSGLEGCRIAIKLDTSAIRDSTWKETVDVMDPHDLMLTNALTVGPGDVLSMNRAALALADAGIEPRLIERWCLGNAMDVFAIER